MAKFKKGDAVRQILPVPVVGTVDSFAVDQETGDLQVKVTTPDGERHFTEDQLEAVPSDAPA
jgi:hypothetical protein